jgi:hypothetical protein
MRSEEQEDEVTSRKKEFLAQLTLLCWASSVCGTSSRRWLRPLPFALELDDWARVIFIVELHNDVHHHPLMYVAPAPPALVWDDHDRSNYASKSELVGQRSLAFGLACCQAGSCRCAAAFESCLHCDDSFER